MKKGILVFIIAVTALLSSNLFAADAVVQLTTPDQIMDQLNADPSAAVGLFECWARNERGQHFRAVDRFPARAQDMAMRECYRYSRFCYAEGCR